MLFAARSITPRKRAEDDARWCRHGEHGNLNAPKAKNKERRTKNQEQKYTDLSLRENRHCERPFPGKTRGTRPCKVPSARAERVPAREEAPEARGEGSTARGEARETHVNVEQNRENLRLTRVDESESDVTASRNPCGSSLNRWGSSQNTVNCSLNTWRTSLNTCRSSRNIVPGCLTRCTTRVAPRNPSLAPAKVNPNSRRSRLNSCRGSLNLGQRSRNSG